MIAELVRPFGDSHAVDLVQQRIERERAPGACVTPCYDVRTDPLAVLGVIHSAGREYGVDER